MSSTGVWTRCGPLSPEAQFTHRLAGYKQDVDSLINLSESQRPAYEWTELQDLTDHNAFKRQLKTFLSERTFTTWMFLAAGHIKCVSAGLDGLDCIVYDVRPHRNVNAICQSVLCTWSKKEERIPNRMKRIAKMFISYAYAFSLSYVCLFGC